MSEATVSQFFQDDHARLDGLFAGFQDHKNSDAGKSRELFREFKQGLERHIQWEEKILFPVFEGKTGMHDTGPTAVMREEHRQIRELLQTIEKRLGDGSARTDHEEALLTGHLGLHNMKEERILYPAIDQSIGEPERKKIFLEIENWEASGKTGM